MLESARALGKRGLRLVSLTIMRRFSNHNIAPILSNKAIHLHCAQRALWGPQMQGVYRGFPTRMVYLHYISCLWYTILVGNPRYLVSTHPQTAKNGTEILCPTLILGVISPFCDVGGCVCLERCSTFKTRQQHPLGWAGTLVMHEKWLSKLSIFIRLTSIHCSHLSYITITIKFQLANATVILNECQGHWKWCQTVQSKDYHHTVKIVTMLSLM